MMLILDQTLLRILCGGCLCSQQLLLTINHSSLSPVFTKTDSYASPLPTQLHLWILTKVNSLESVRNTLLADKGRVGADVEALRNAVEALFGDLLGSFRDELRLLLFLAVRLVGDGCSLVLLLLATLLILFKLLLLKSPFL